MVLTTYKGRLVVKYFSIISAVILCLFSAGYYLAVKEISAMTDKLLEKTADEKISEISKNPEKYSATEVIEVFDKNYFKVIKSETGVYLRSVKTDEKGFFHPDFLRDIIERGRVYKTEQTSSGNVRTLFVPVDEEYVIQLSLPLDTQENLLLKTRNFFIGAVIILLPVSFIIAWVLANWAVKPFIKITGDAYEIANKNLKGRLSADYNGIEFSNLSLVFNSILDRIERFVENQKRFTSDISHEIRSPLTAIKGNLEVTLKRKRSTEEYEETMKSVLEEIDRIIRLVNNLLFLARVDNQELELNMKEFNLGSLLEKIIISRRHLISEKGLNIETNWDDIMFYGDETLIRQLFLNLFDNALQYTPQGGSVSIYASLNNGGLTVTVSDTGVGIPANEIKKVFARFYRVRQNLNMHETGSGLGLYLSRWIAESHGGEITVESEPDKGSTFLVYLPVLS